MKKLLWLFVIGLICLPVSADDNRLECRYVEGYSFSSFSYTPGQTVEQYCDHYCANNEFKDFWKDQCDKCKKEDYPRALRAYNSGACHKILPPQKFDNIEGCNCTVRLLDDGSIYMKSCINLGSGDTDKAMQKLESMIKEKKK